MIFSTLATVYSEVIGNYWAFLRNQGLEPESASGGTSSHCHSEARLAMLSLNGLGCPPVPSLPTGCLSWPWFQSPDGARSCSWWVSTEALEAGGEDQRDKQPGELKQPVGFALTHLTILGKTNQTGSQPGPRPRWVPTDY